MAKISIRLIVAGLMLAGLAVYAAEKHSDERWASYAFEFDERGKDTGIKVLDWKLGDAPFSFMHAPNSGPVPQTDNATGKMPVADFLYFKWRVIATGKVYEDKVDLKSRLPANMEDKILQFSINESQLYVYLIEGNTSAYLHAKAAPDCPASPHQPFRCTELYPKYWKNF